MYAHQSLLKSELTCYFSFLGEGNNLNIKMAHKLKKINS